MDKMHTDFNPTSLLGFNSADSDPEGSVKARMTADDHRQAHAFGLARLRGRVKTRGTRAIRRQQEANQRRQQRTATRRYRREQIQALQDHSTALGLARVYLERAGNPAMRSNVGAHVAHLCREVAEARHPEIWADDTLSPEDSLRAKAVALQEAHDDIMKRFQEVLDAS